jgi:hypothetical protein
MLSPIESFEDGKEKDNKLNTNFFLLTQWQVDKMNKHHTGLRKKRKIVN